MGILQPAPQRALAREMAFRTSATAYGGICPYRQCTVERLFLSTVRRNLLAGGAMPGFLGRMTQCSSVRRLFIQTVRRAAKPHDRQSIVCRLDSPFWRSTGSLRTIPCQPKWVAVAHAPTGGSSLYTQRIGTRIAWQVSHGRVVAAYRTG